MTFDVNVVLRFREIMPSLTPLLWLAILGAPVARHGNLSEYFPTSSMYIIRARKFESLMEPATAEVHAHWGSFVRLLITGK